MKEDLETPGAATMSIEEIKAAATTLAQQIKAMTGPLPADLRKRFVRIRAALFQRGVYDPILVRFDSATVPPASVAELADQLSAVAASL
jgi:hypothetical protein